jgi:DNA-binding XRE family transcriptional regulator
MVTIVPKFIETQGAELVLLTRAEFDHLMAIAEDAEENAADIALYDARKAALDADAHPMLPPEVSAMLLRGDRLLKALRKWRGLTQVDLALKAGLAQGYLSDLESGRRTGTDETLKLLAEKLEIDPSWLMECTAFLHTDDRT